MAGIKRIPDENLILGFESSDDAAVYKVTEDLCVIHTVDFFPPIVDDPYEFGLVAAANSISDVYAMGGTPISALNILCVPEDFDHELITKRILEGGSDKAAEAGINICGGHSLEDEEPKYGLSVVGVAKIQDIRTNGGARVGDVLVLTKPLGSGILATADKAGLLSKAEHDDLVALMAQLNRWPHEQSHGLDISSCTDITGFGLVGHAGEMAEASNLTFTIHARYLPLQKNALEMAKDGIIPAGAYDNRRFMCGRYESSKDLPLALEDICFDPQTSGGLLYAMSEESAVEYLRRCKEAGVGAWLIGEVGKRENVAIRLWYE